MALTWRYYPQDSDVNTIPDFKDDALNNPGVQPDRTFTSADVSASNMRNGVKGVVRGVYNTFETTVSATSSTDVEITSGAGNWYGYTLTAEGDYDTIEIDSLPSNSRIDVLVLEFDPNGSRTNYVSWKVGIESPTPVAPNVDDNQIALYEVELTSSGITSITDAREYLGDYYTKEEVDNKINGAKQFENSLFSGSLSLNSTGNLNYSYKNYNSIIVNYEFNGAVSGYFQFTPTEGKAFYKDIISIATDSADEEDLFIADVLIFFTSDTSVKNAKARVMKIVAENDNNLITNYKTNLVITSIVGYN